MAKLTGISADADSASVGKAMQRYPKKITGCYPNDYEI
jgi:hypothetical protein